MVNRVKKKWDFFSFKLINNLYVPNMVLLKGLVPQKTRAHMTTFTENKKNDGS